ncbi:MAG TPA: DUF6134 family protein [Acetobacteraceae bacterium]|jgi:hypothetical protein|nr:DUF6134 family protein [Acetobacteraceae bacterium]
MLHGSRKKMVPQTIGRRAVLCAAAVGFVRPATAALPVPPHNALGFRMIRHGDEIGTHRLTFEHGGDTLTVHIAVDAVVTLLSIPIVRYTHRGVETWQGTTLVGLAGETNKNGEHEWVKAGRTSEGLLVQGSQSQPYIAPETAIPTSYWNKRMLDGRMISLEDGVLLAPKVAALRTESIRVASGNVIPANHYALSGPFSLDLWYDDAEAWAGMAMTVADGSEVRYERL